MLKIGVPWNAIQEISESEVYIILGISAAFDQKEAEDEQRAMASMKT
tara:strand:- start:1454 stop:1594 length:141 start_codon:yes stop_codon:yes gene_type:complete